MNDRIDQWASAISAIATTLVIMLIGLAAATALGKDPWPVMTVLLAWGNAGLVYRRLRDATRAVIVPHG